MSAATLISAEAASGTPQINPWLIGVLGSLATFMEVFDTSIASVALPYIAGSMGATYSMLNAQAQALSCIDIYWLLSPSVLMFFLCLLLAKNKPGGSGNIQMH